MKGTRSSVIGLRLSVEELAKLDALAHRTFRGRAEVVRFLLAHTEAAQLGGLIFDPPVATATAGSAESR